VISCALRALLAISSPMHMGEAGRGRLWWCALSRGLIGSGFRPRTTCYFLLRGQKKLTKEKAAPMSRPAGPLRYSPGAGSSDGTSVCRRKNARHPWRAPCGQFRPGLRCSARQRGLKVKPGSPSASRGWRALRARKNQMRVGLAKGVTQRYPPITLLNGDLPDM
jgi:hypothetical protein